MIEVVNAFKNIISSFIPMTGGTSHVFELLGNGLCLLVLGWVFYSVLFFIVRGYKSKK